MRRMYHPRRAVFRYVFVVYCASHSIYAQVNERRLPALPVTVQKSHENQEDLEEKFGKFGLPQTAARLERHRKFLQLKMTFEVYVKGDETHSVISDAWSTDVVASDNEGANEGNPTIPPGGVVPAGGLPGKRHARSLETRFSPQMLCLRAMLCLCRRWSD